MPVSRLAVPTAVRAAAGLCGPRSRRRRRRLGGFTLVELLMVIVIIGMLMALLITAIGSAVRRGKQAAIQAEIGQLGMAMEAYKAAKGSYPPDFTVNSGSAGDAYYRDVVLPHVRRAYPRYTGYSTTNAHLQAGNFYTDFNNRTGRNRANLDPAEALVFWLGGVPRPGGAVELSGFSSDPRDPFANVDLQPQRGDAFFDFPASRLADRDGDGWPEFYPPHTNLEAGWNQAAPYVYFAHRPGASQNVLYGGEYLANPGGIGRARPYMAQSNLNNAYTAGETWLNPQSYQIISAGLDNSFGEPLVDHFYPNGFGTVEEELDNQANFSQGAFGN